MADGASFALDDGGGVAWDGPPPSVGRFHEATAPLLATLATPLPDAAPPREVAAARAFRGALVAAIHAARRDLAETRARAIAGQARAAYAEKTRGRAPNLVKRADIEHDAAKPGAHGEL